MKNEHLTLLELNGLVRQVIETALPREYWVEAELSECRESRGHCYMELVQYPQPSTLDPPLGRRTLAMPEPSTFNKTPVARASAKCWASKWMIIRPYFERTTGQRLQAGMKVLLKVYPQFHEAYGFSWIVTDIDPTFTLGDQARRRQEIISQLKAEGVFDLQRELSLPLFCLNIAVISSQTAAGYGDFAAQLADSPFAFRTQLFPATMQGEGVEQSVIDALERIYDTTQQPSPITQQPSPITQQPSPSTFDCVVIIRGGGATSDMSGFDTLALAENVANFPIPIITGIGHDRDECILDMVSHQRVKTPTAAAAFLIDHAQTVLNALDDAQADIARMAQQKLSTLNAQLATLQSVIPRLFSVVKTRHEARLSQLYGRMAAAMQQRITSQRGRLDTYLQRLPLILERRLTAERHRLELTAEKLKMLDPQLLLRRGYSITLKDGHAVHDPKLLRPGDLIQTRLEKGTINSQVIQ